MNSIAYTPVKVYREIVVMNYESWDNDLLSYLEDGWNVESSTLDVGCVIYKIFRYE